MSVFMFFVFSKHLQKTRLKDADVFVRVMIYADEVQEQVNKIAQRIFYSLKLDGSQINQDVLLKRWELQDFPMFT